MIAVWQSIELQFPFGKLKGFDRDEYVKVAEVDIEDADHARAFELTNNITHAWTENPEVTPTDSVIERGGCRSTSVGDVIILSDGKILQCASCGWEHIGFAATRAGPFQGISRPVSDREIDELARETCEEAYDDEYDEDQEIWENGFMS
jgi:hypothetical protein